MGTMLEKRGYVLSIFILHIMFIGCLYAGSTDARKVYVMKSADGWRLMVEGKPYTVKGLCYRPTKIGEDPGNGTQRDWMIIDDDNDGRCDSAYQSWVDKNRNNKRDPDEPEVGDFQLWKEMGCNTLRIYHPATADRKIQAIDGDNSTCRMLYHHAPNKKLLRELFNNYGIRVAMGNLLGAYTVATGARWEDGTDYTSQSQKKNMLASVEAMVKEHKDEPYLLMWIVGNENNLAYANTNASKYPKEYAKFVNEAAKLIHRLDRDHPVCLCNGEIDNIDMYKKYAPEIDIFGVNTYRSDPGFGSMWNDVSQNYDKPVLLTEYGTGYPKVINGVMDEDYQAEKHKNTWLDIYRHTAGHLPPGNALGGFAFEWLDNWWEDGKPFEQNINPSGSGWNHEYNGIISQGDGSQSPLLRQIRKVYYTYQDLWKAQ